MGLVSLVGGGMPPFDSTATSTGDGTSTNPPIALGSRALDSSGGEYVLCRTASTAAALATLHSLNSSIGNFHAVIVPVSVPTDDLWSVTSSYAPFKKKFRAMTC